MATEAPEALKNFRNLNAALKDADEEVCVSLLNHERANGKRHEFLIRIYGRWNKLRAQRERLELIQRAKQ